MDLGCDEDVMGGQTKAAFAFPQNLNAAAPPTKKTKRALDPKDIAQSKYERLEDKWQLRLPLIQKAWDLDPSDPLVKQAVGKSWLADKSDEKGRWLGVGCIACAAAAASAEAQKDRVSFGGTSKAARSFKDFSVSTEEALQWSNLERHHKMAGHKTSVLRYLGLSSNDEVDTSGAPMSSDFLRVLEHVATGSAASQGLPGIGDKGKIIKMVFCLAEAKTLGDRIFVKGAALLSLRRDGQTCLPMLCCATIVGQALFPHEPPDRFRHRRDKYHQSHCDCLERVLPRRAWCTAVETRPGR